MSARHFKTGGVQQNSVKHLAFKSDNRAKVIWRVNKK
jgi:hypothetical protein